MHRRSAFSPAATVLLAFLLLTAAALKATDPALTPASPVAAADNTADPAAPPVLPLPGLSDGDGGSTSIRLGEKAVIDSIGPTVVSEDGTLRVIANWGELSDAERAVAWRRITKRNRERLATLKQDFDLAAQQQQAEELQQQQAGEQQQQQQQQQSEGGQQQPTASQQEQAPSQPSGQHDEL